MEEVQEDLEPRAQELTMHSRDANSTEPQTSPPWREMKGDCVHGHHRSSDKQVIGWMGKPRKAGGGT